MYFSGKFFLVLFEATKFERVYAHRNLPPIQYSLLASYVIWHSFGLNTPMHIIKYVCQTM